MRADKRQSSKAAASGPYPSELNTAEKSELLNTTARRVTLIWTAEGRRRHDVAMAHARAQKQRFASLVATRREPISHTSPVPSATGRHSARNTRKPRSPPAHNDIAPALAVSPARAVVELSLPTDDEGYYRLIGGAETQRLSGTKRSSMYAAIAIGAFPAPVKVGRSSRWVFGEVVSWTKNRIAERDREVQSGQRER